MAEEIPDVNEELDRVETLSHQHHTLHHGGGHAARKSALFIKGATGEDAVDSLGFCNMCNKHVVADGS